MTWHHPWQRYMGYVNSGMHGAYGAPLHGPFAYPVPAPPIAGAFHLGDAMRAPVAPGGRKLREYTDEQLGGIEGRVKLIRGLVGKSIRDPSIRQLALWVTRACPWRDDRCELSAIWHFMQQNIRYTGDIAGYDTFQSARVTVENRGGDCDDGLTLITALAMCNGFGVKGRITSNPRAPRQWAHIFPMVGVPKNNPTRWFTMDWTLGAARFGAHPPYGKFLDFDGYQIKYSPSEITTNDYEGW